MPFLTVSCLVGRVPPLKYTQQSWYQRIVSSLLEGLEKQLQVSTNLAETKRRHLLRYGPLSRSSKPLPRRSCVFFLPPDTHSVHVRQMSGCQTRAATGDGSNKMLPVAGDPNKALPQSHELCFRSHASKSFYEAGTLLLAHCTVAGPADA